MLKYFLRTFISSFILLSAVAALAYFINNKIEIDALELRERDNVELKATIIRDIVRPVISDLRYLSVTEQFRKMPDRLDLGWRSAVADDFLAFSASKGIYEQIRFIDAAGMEMVRVDFNGSRAAPVPEDRLQDKSGRYYFVKAMEMGRSGIYMSPLDLNVEAGSIEEPFKPMLRFATPVFGRGAEAKGILILNYSGRDLLEQFDAASRRPGVGMLLNSDGYWLRGPSRESEWGFMFEDRGEVSFARAHPGAWKRIENAESGQFHVEDGLFTFLTIRPLPGQLTNGGEYRWKVVNHIPAGSMTAAVDPFFKRFLTLYATAAVFIAVLSWYLARLSYQRKQSAAALASRKSELEAANSELCRANERLNFEVIERKGAEDGLRRVNLELTEALEAVKTLSGMLPICASCKKVRDDKGYWHQVEEYLRKHSELEFSHGVCPDCVRRLYPDLAEQVLKCKD